MSYWAASALYYLSELFFKQSHWALACVFLMTAIRLGILLKIEDIKAASYRLRAGLCNQSMEGSQLSYSDLV